MPKWITIKVTEEVKHHARMVAAREDCGLNEAIRRAVVDRLTKRLMPRSR